MTKPNELETSIINLFIDYLNESGIYYKESKFKRDGKIRLINSIEANIKLKAYDMTKDKTLKTTLSDKELIAKAKELLLKEQERKDKAKKAREQEAVDSFGEPIHAETQELLASFDKVEDVFDMFYYYNLTASDRIIYFRKPSKGFELEPLFKSLELTKKYGNILLASIQQQYPDKYNELADAIDSYNYGRESKRKIPYDLAVFNYLQGSTFTINKALDTEPTNFTTNKDVPTFKYLDVSKVGNTSGLCKAWDNFTGRLSIKGTKLDAQKYYRAFIWSIFEEKDPNRSFLYLYDEGKTGKSKTTSIIQNFLGQGKNGCSTAFDFSATGSHSTEILLGKRLVVNNESWVKKTTTNPILKSITGGDPIPVNPKNKSAFSVVINAKVIFLSNQPPVVGMDRAELTRLLPVTVSEITESDYSPTFEEDLIKELPVFLTKCKEDYSSLKSSTKYGDFLSIDKELSKSDDFRDYNSQVVANILDQYRFESSTTGQKHIDITAIISKIIREDAELKEAKISATSPPIFEALSKAAKKMGGSYIKKVGFKGFKGVRLVEKKSNKDNDMPI